MHNRTRRLAIFGCALALLLSPLIALAQGLRPGDLDMRDAAGNLLSGGRLSAVGEYTVAPGGPGLLSAVVPQAQLTRADYQQVYDQATALYGMGAGFRQRELQLPPRCSANNIGDCLISYRNFGDGRIFYRYCADYDWASFNQSGACRPWGSLSSEEQRQRVPTIGTEALAEPYDLRNKLLRARSLYGFLALSQPADVVIDQGPIRQLGRSGVVSATRELVNIHLIFGQESLVDALDYRFGGGDPRAEAIIREEISQLEEALDQFRLALDVLGYALNANLGGPSGSYIADFFGPQEYELFARVSERTITTLSEIAQRYRQLGDDRRALALYADTYAEQYVQIIALASSAADDKLFLSSGGWRLMNNLEQLRARAGAIRDGLNPFGYSPEYVPIQAYDDLRAYVLNDLVERDAGPLEVEARNAQREFDERHEAFRSAMTNLAGTHDRQLLDLCGQQPDDYQTCDGGQMEQNRQQMIGAFLEVRAARERIETNLEDIAIEQEKSREVIGIVLGGGERLALLELARGMTLAYRTSETVVNSESQETYLGEETRATATISANPIKFLFNTSIDIEQTFLRGNRWSSTTTSAVETVWDPSQEELARYNSLQAMQQVLDQAAIERANDTAYIKRRLLERASLLIELDLALNRVNQISAEHNTLVATHRFLLNLRQQARQDIAESSFTNPVHRILRDGLTIKASDRLSVATQYAYLVAKAFEYEYLTAYPQLAEIYKARTAADIRIFLNDLENYRRGLTSPTSIDRYPRRISLARDIFGLSDANIDPERRLSASQRAQRRFEAFQARLRSYMVTNPQTGAATTLEIPFATSLLDNTLFSPDVWNHRIAGVGQPEGLNTQGVALNLVTRQFGELGVPQVALVHGGHATYRDIRGSILTYTPAPARPVGFSLPPGFDNRITTALINASVNRNGRGTPNRQLFNLSVAASSWKLRINLRAPDNLALDLAQLEDIEIDMDTTAFAAPNREAQARELAQHLQSSFDAPTQP